jgi:subtilisin family serine protease
LVWLRRLDERLVWFNLLPTRRILLQGLMDNLQFNTSMKPSQLPFVTTLMFLLLASPLFAQTQRVWYGKHRVHPTRLIALYTNDVAAPAKMKTAAQATAIQAIAAQVSEHVTRSYALRPGLVVLEPAATATTLTVAGATPKTEPDLKARIRALMATGAFKYVEPDYELTTSLTPTDARFTDGTLWGLKNSGQSGGVVGADINAEAAWNITTGAASVIVAVIDTGIRYTHQDLATQMWVNPGEIPGNGVDDDGDGYVDNVHGINAIIDFGNPMDDNDHGTHCAGTIGAAANSGGPHVGVAWTVRLMACKFLDANGSGNTSDAIECINFAVANGARVLNNSWGGGPFQQALFDAIVSARDQGVLFVAAAGNGGADGVGDNNDAAPSYPASYAVDNIISVAAVNRANQLADFSNFGLNTVHLGAPGVDIYSTTSGADNEYQVFAGTSMAAPHVSGVAALVLAQNPAISYSELRQRILQGAVPIPALAGKTLTGGRLNALNALVAIGDNQLETSIYSTEGTAVSAGSVIPVFVKVTDLTNINTATVTGTIPPAIGSISFLNNGVAPDAAPGDGLYSAHVSVPTVGTSFSLKVVATAPGKLSVTNTVVFTIRQAPPNDAFANAIVLASGGDTVAGANIYATSQNLEPEACDAGGGKTVWWRWTAPQNQITTLSTFGSNFDTVLAVYTGNSVGALTPVICNDDVPGGVYSSEVIFPAVANTTYHIAVDGYAGDEGLIALTLAETPPTSNDDFADRAPITGINRTVRGSNFGATREGAEPFHCGGAGSASVWWTWTAPSNMVVAVSTAGSTYDTLLAVYTGASLGALLPVDCNDDYIPGGIFSSEVSFSAVGGVTYQIAVDGYEEGFTTEQGNITLSLVTTPANDLFSNRMPLHGAFAQAQGHNIRADYEPGEPLHSDAGGDRSVWWTWTAPGSGTVALTTRGSTFDTTLGVYTGNAVHNLTPVTSNDDEASPVLRTSRATFSATVGTAYHFAVDGYFITDIFEDPLGTEAGLISLTLSLDGKSRLDGFKLRPDGHYEFMLLGDSGRKYEIESTTNLTAPWSVIGEFVLNGPSTSFIDPVPASGSRRFYRAALAPLTQ